MEVARNRDRKYKKRVQKRMNIIFFLRLNTTIFISLLNASRESNKMRNSIIIPDIINISTININNDKFKYYNKRAFVYTIDPRRFIHLYNFNIFPPPIFIYIYAFDA